MGGSRALSAATRRGCYGDLHFAHWFVRCPGDFKLRCFHAALIYLFKYEHLKHNNVCYHSIRQPFLPKKKKKKKKKKKNSSLLEQMAPET